MNVIGHFTLRSLRQNRKWTVVTIIGIIISTAMITAVSTFCASFMGLMQNTVREQTGNWHASFSGVRASRIKTVESAGFVGRVMLGREIGYAKLAGSQNKQKPYLFIEQFDTESEKNFPTTLVSGRMPRNGRELVLSQSVQTNARVKIRVGEKLTLALGQRVYPGIASLTQNVPYQSAVQADPQEGIQASKGETLLTRFTRTYTVVGIIKRPAFERLTAPGYTAVTYLDDKTLKPDDTVKVTILARNLNHDFFSEIRSLAKKIGVSGSAVSINSELLRYYGVVSGDNTQRMLYAYAAVLIFIIMIASVALIYNAFAISVSERTRQLGMLASVGATRRQKRQNVYLEGFLLGIVGIPAGILAGIAGAGATILAVSPKMDTFMNIGDVHLTLVVSPAAVLSAILFAALTIFVSAWIPARRASKITPIEAIRMSKEIRLTGKTVKTSPLTRLLFGFEGELALKNLKRSRKKYRATVLSLTISLVLFLTVSYFAQFFGNVSQAALYGVNYDFSVRYANATFSAQQDTDRQIAALEPVKRAVTMQVLSGTASMKSSQLTAAAKKSLPSGKRGTYRLSAAIYAMDDASFQQYAKSLGLNPKDYENAAKPQVILINYGVSSANGVRTAGAVSTVKPGASLAFGDFDAKTGSPEASKSRKVEIGALTDKRPMGVLTQSLNSMAFVTSRACLSAFLSGKETGQLGEQLFLTAKDSAKLQKGIDTLTSRLKKGQALVNNIAEEDQRENNVMLVLGIFVYGFILLISLICVANIFNTITTSMSLRRKEFAMLRSVGMTPGSVNRMIRFESVFYGLKGLLYGLPISVAVALLLYRLQAGTLNMGFTLPLTSYAAAILLIFLIVLVTMLYASSKIKKENIVDALKDEML